MFCLHNCGAPNIKRSLAALVIVTLGYVHRHGYRQLSLHALQAAKRLGWVKGVNAAARTAKVVWTDNGESADVSVYQLQVRTSSATLQCHCLQHSVGSPAWPRSLMAWACHAMGHYSELSRCCRFCC